MTTPTVVPNPGFHLTNYTIILSQPGETFCTTIKSLCENCAVQTPNKSKMGEVINGYCDGCGTGPSVSHYQLAAGEPPTDAPGNDCPDHGPHADDHCPKCRAIAAGRAIFRHWNRRPQHFAETLRRLDPSIWHVLAASYAAYRGIAVEDVLTFWWLAVTGTSQLPPRVHPLIEQADAAAESYASKL